MGVLFYLLNYNVNKCNINLTFLNQIKQFFTKYILYIFTRVKKETENNMSLLASFMKANTRMQIDRKNYQLTCATIQHNRIQEQIQELSQTDDMMRSSWESIKANLSSIGASVFTATTSFTVQAFTEKQTAYQKALSDAKGDENNQTVKNAKADMLSAQEQAKSVSETAMAARQAGQAGLDLASQSFSSVFDASNKAQQAYLHSQDKSYDLEKANLETQLKDLNAQYDSYEKLEDADAKKTAPNFGIA